MATDGAYCDFIKVSWDASPGATSYQVWRSTVNSSPTATQIASVASSPFLDPAVVPGVLYYYWVRAIAGGGSLFSVADAGFIGPPPAPTGVLAGDGDYCDRVRVSWNPVAGATDFEIWRGSTSNPAAAALLGTSPASPFDDTTAAPGARYFYFVRPVGLCGTGPFGAGDFGGVTLPPPSTVSASDQGYCDRVVVSWAAVPGASGYEVWRAGANDPASAIKAGAAAASPFEDLSVVQGTTYFYWVRTVNACGAGAFGTANAGGTGPLPPPAAVTATPVPAPCGVGISWSAVAGATSYGVWRNVSGDPGGAVQVGTSPTTTFLDTTAAAQVPYEYRVRGIQPCGFTAFGGPAAVLVPPLPPPSPVTATDGAFCDRVQVSWPGVAGAEGYEVWRGPANDPATAIRIGTGATSPFDDTSVLPTTTWFYWVRSVNGCGTGPFGAADAGAVTLPPATTLAATDLDYCDRVGVSWDPVPGAQGYQVWRAEADDPGGAVQVGSSAASFFADFAVVPGVTYYYWVRSVNACGVGVLGASDAGTAGPLRPPSALTVSPITQPCALLVTWTPVGGASFYEIWRSTSGELADAQRIATTIVTSIADVTAAESIKYHYWVRALGPCGTSGFGERGSHAGFLPQTLATVALTVGGCSVIQVQWQPWQSGSTYHVWKSTTNDPAGAARIATTQAWMIYDFEVYADSVYYYWVTTPSSCGESRFGAAAPGKTGTPAVPQALAATGGCDRVRLTWAPAGGAEWYEVWRSPVDDLASASFLRAVPGPSYEDVYTDRLQFYWVRAVHSQCGVGGFSVGVPGEPAGPFMVSRPTNVAVYPGQTAAFWVWASGSGLFTYQWSKDGTTLSDGGRISGARARVLTISAVEPADSGSYSVQVAGACTVQVAARLTVLQGQIGVGAVSVELGMSAPWPNPARGAMSVTVRLPQQAAVEVTVEDVQGRPVRNLAAGRLPAGEHAVGWDGRDHAARRVAAGVYFIRMRVEGKSVAVARAVVLP